MNLLLRKFRHLGLNSRYFTEDDFFEICEAERIRVKESEEFSWWMNLDGESCIILDRHLRGYELLYTMMHELAHHFLHHGDELHAIEASGANNSKNESEAHKIAVIAVYPRKALKTGDLLEFEKYDPFLKTIRLEREKIYNESNGTI